MHLLAKPSFRSETEAVAHQKHPDQQFKVDRQAVSVAVEVFEVRTDSVRVNNGSNEHCK